MNNNSDAKFSVYKQKWQTLNMLMENTDWLHRALNRQLKLIYKENMKHFGILVQNGNKYLQWIYTEKF